MAKIAQDVWAGWLLKRRFGGNPEQLKATLNHLYPIRDKVLLHANVGKTQTLLDVGCGDGLLGFGALEKTPEIKVLFSDVSEELLEHARALAQELGVLNRCRFVRASAEDLSEIDDESVEGVATRSVLIYVAAKQQAFKEFYRVLKQQGRLSIFEPINSFRYPEPRHLFAGYDVTPVADIAQRLKAASEKIQPPGKDPMLDFDERNLLEFAEQAGFKEIHLELHAEVKPNDWEVDWDTWIHIAPNPKMPTLHEIMRDVLSLDERERFLAHLRPLFEAKKSTVPSAVAYLWAVK